MLLALLVPMLLLNMLPALTVIYTDASLVLSTAHLWWNAVFANQAS